ncbi:hypothetical protein FE257_012034 [Aspergillus nanangensis]|uniref:FHA domain-containing protein n=1 Tax=Aspergillus nanangensis TaxID=2582783 RepID=A0AAD4CGL9_ASPNN|nr:hypothetical protein FE257_012034 [Aspergillus nanangensis]
MTAVASPPSVQSGPRLGWYSAGNGGQGALSSMNADEVSPVSNTRSQAVPGFSSGPAASSTTMSALHQPSSIVPSQHMYQSQQQNGVRGGGAPSGDPPAILTLIPINGTFEKKQITVPYYPDALRIGRQTNTKTAPSPMNGYFDSKVLSRQHAEIWADKSGKIWIRDVKSSNGTFINGRRLSQENRESEPNEIRENDQLDLGIDIISEDQKTVVHHKVCAKVEYAGVYGTVPNILDLTLGDLDPASGGGLLPSPLSQPLSHLRGRSGSNVSNRSAQSAASTQFNALQQQRQMNYWNSPISIEQVVKRLTAEMKQAKQQTQDLRQTDEFLTTIMKPGHIEKGKARQSPPESTSSRQINGRPKMPRVDSFSRFSDPPAPPPQQPLPEKPDALPRNGIDAISPLKRSDTEKPKPGSAGSPVSRESSQILSLIEALSSAKRELDSQGARVKELENLLLQERSARESAEERARNLEINNKDQGVPTSIPTDTHFDQSETVAEERPTDTPDNELSPEPTLAEPMIAEVSVDAQTSQLQLRLEAMMEEMEEVRKQMSHFKDRALKAENETVETRKSLSEMIETIRKEHGECHDGISSSKALPDTPNGPNLSGNEKSKELDDVQLDASPEPSIISPPTNGAESSSTTLATHPHRHGTLEQSSPYASMLGVVLLGVGLMAYLNGWQKMDK